MYDTISAMRTETVLDAGLFGGGSVVEDFDTGQSHARLWLNPSGDGYAPRVTYWPDGRVLKVEFSVPKLAGCESTENPTPDEVELALDRVDAYLDQHFGVSGVRSWLCQRIDYAWMWDVGTEIGTYMQMLSGLRIAGTVRQSYGKDGVVWKAGNRWVKFYRRGETLRYEVSSYKRAVKYMCAEWFDCVRTVDELVHEGRALYVLAYFWEKLGLHAGTYSSEASLLRRLRDVYQRGVSGAWYALTLMREFGVDAYKSDLISANNYHTWKRRLLDDGFVVIVGDDVDVCDAVSVLSLPVERVVENLKLSPRGASLSPSKNFPNFVTASSSGKNLQNLEVLNGLHNA